jgi:glycerophosphoryl diester phosphodiesterase
MINRFVFVACTFLFALALRAQTPLTNIHAHNDYWHSRPLLAALDEGICSVEADVHLIDGELRVGHKPEEATHDRTLQRLYLDPLRARAQANGGRVFRNAPTVDLLIDIKSASKPTYAALEALLAHYTEMLTRYDSGHVTERAVTVIVTGGYPRDVIASETSRLVACDGGIDDLNSSSPPPVDLVPQVQANWRDYFTWRGVTPMPADQRTHLIQLIAKAHAQHRRIRFWNAPDRPTAWRELLTDGVDLINTDDLKGCADFVRKQKPSPTNLTKAHD